MELSVGMRTTAPLPEDKLSENRRRKLRYKVGERRSRNNGRDPEENVAVVSSGEGRQEAVAMDVASDVDGVEVRQ